MKVPQPPINMPRSSPKKHLGAMAQSAQKKNTALIAHITDNSSGDTLFARIDANMGSYFRLTIHDGITTTQLLGSPRGLFKQRRAQVRFATNDIVILGGMPSGSQVSEIIGLLDKASAQDLFKQGRIHKSVYTPLDSSGTAEAAVEDIFDYGDAEEANEVDINNI